MPKDNANQAADDAAKAAAEAAAAAAAAAEKDAADKAAADAAAEAEKDAADKAAADDAAKAKAEAAAKHKEQVEADCAELGIKPDKNNRVEIELLVSLAGANVKAAGEPHVCGPAEAVRMIRAGYAKLPK